MFSPLICKILYECMYSLKKEKVLTCNQVCLLHSGENCKRKLQFETME